VGRPGVEAVGAERACRGTERNHIPAEAGAVEADTGTGSGEAAGGGVEMLTYAYLTYAHQRDAGRSHWAAGDSPGRNLSGRYGGARRTHRADRTASHHGVCDCERPRPEVAGDGAAQHRGVGATNLLPLWLV